MVEIFFNSIVAFGQSVLNYTNLGM